MFSWSNGTSTTTTTKKRTGATYPGRRNNAASNGHGPVTATTIEGSIRPPDSKFTRAQHLQSYLEDSTLKRSTRRVSSDDTTFDTVFQTTQGDTLILRVHMPLSSSMTFCPAMSLAGVRVRHNWVDSRMRIEGYAPIQSENAFRTSGLSLGQAVHAVVKQLQLYPPEVLEITDRGLEAIQSKQKQNKPKSGSGTAARATGGRSQEAPPDYSMVEENTNFAPVPDIPMPPIPSSYPEIDDLSREELDHLLEDELDFLSLVRKLDTFKEIHTAASGLMNSNVNLANANISHQGELTQRHAEVVQLQAQLKEKVEQFQKLERQQNALCAPPDKRVALKQLNKAKRQAFDESEQVAEEWVESGGAVDDFVRQFLDKRVLHHQRAAKMELLQQSNS